MQQIFSLELEKTMNHPPYHELAENTAFVKIAALTQLYRCAVIQQYVLEVLVH